MNRSSTLLLVLIFILSISTTMVWADEKTTDTKKTTWQDLFTDVVGHYPLPSIAIDNDNTEQKNKINIPKNWEFGLEMKRLVASHTSYEFGANGGDFSRPISRLEFPVNTWWLNFDVRRTCPRWSVGGRAGFSVNRNSNNWMIDSDWDSEGSEHFLSDYSKGYDDIREALLFRGDVDVNISDWLRLPPSLELRPLFAFQFQRFYIVSHDDIAWSYAKGTVSDLRGNTVSFRQDWYTYMIGMRGSYSFNLSKYMTVKIKGEADWGPAIGHSEDHHILRGDRFSYEDTLGNALYFLTGLDMTVSKTITMGIGIDYLWIRTSGTRRSWDPSTNTNESWTDGVHVWSDQLGLTAHVSYAF
jgi:hypothetical protein